MIFFAVNFVQRLAVREFWKSVKFSWSYRLYGVVQKRIPR